MRKSDARNIVLFLLTLVISLSTQLPRLEFDYDFENLFSTDNPDISFYQQYRKIYGNDNDYILLALQPTQGVFDSTFLARLQAFETELGTWPQVKYTLSPISANYLIKSPAGFTPVPYMRVKSSQVLKSDSARIINKPEQLAYFFSPDFDASILIIRHKEMDNFTGKKFVRNVEQSLEKHDLSPYLLAGKAKAQSTFITYIQKDFGTFTGLGAVLIMVILWLLFRSVPMLLISFAIIGCVLIFTFGIMAIFGIPIDVMSALIPLILIIVCISDIIHFLTRFQKEFREKGNLQEAIMQTWKEVGLATFLTSFTTAIGFFTLLTAASIPIGTLGLFTGIGVLAAFGFTLLILPACLTLFPDIFTSQRQPPENFQFLDQWLSLLLDNRWKILIMAFLVTGASLWGIQYIKIDARLIDDLPKGTGVSESFVYFDEVMGGSKPWELSLEVADKENTTIYDWENLKHLYALEAYLQETYGVVSINSPLTYVRAYHKATTGNYALPDSSQYAAWQSSWRMIRSKQWIEKFNDEAETLARMTGFVSDMGSAKSIAADEKLAAFLDDLLKDASLTYQLTGTTFLIDRSHQIITLNLLKGLLIAVLSVAMIAGLVFQNVWLVVVTVISNLLPLLLIAATLGYFGINLSLSNGIVFAVSFGIAVDDSLHMLSKYQIEIKKKISHFQAVQNTLHSTGKAIINTTIILVAGFALFSFSSFNTTFSIGLLVSLTLLYALLTDLILIPILLCLPYKVRRLHTKNIG